jgi:hypothetical protein
VCVFAICTCDVDVVLILFSDVFLTCSVVLLFVGVMSPEERRLANGSLGFSTRSPSLDIHLWAVRCGYLAGPGMVRLGPTFVSMLAWLATLDIGVVVPAFRVCSCVNFEEGASHDCDMLKALVGSVLSGELTEGSISSRFSQFSTVLFSMILFDLASLRES